MRRGTERQNANVDGVVNQIDQQALRRCVGGEDERWRVVQFDVEHATIGVVVCKHASAPLIETINVVAIVDGRSERFFNVVQEDIQEQEQEQEDAPILVQQRQECVFLTLARQLQVPSAVTKQSTTYASSAVANTIVSQCTGAVSITRGSSANHQYIPSKCAKQSSYNKRM
jgi:hypothetical protein